jgi:hypothetical protein
MPRKGFFRTVEISELDFERLCDSVQLVRELKRAMRRLTKCSAGEIERLLAPRKDAY